FYSAALRGKQQNHAKYLCPRYPARPRQRGTMAALGGRLLVAGAGATVTRSGAILPKPVKTPFGLLRVFSVVIPFLYVGTQISKNFAALLEEHDIFVPEDDDDDD
uniref:Essential MCU regulator, mitochondrial n=1 Tax=Coturnix japonica TaxID=93934 RepID=A0A8C2TBR2_COTJA